MVKLQIIGKITRDAQVAVVSGKTVVNFSIEQISHYIGDDGKEYEKTFWIGCSYWTEKTDRAAKLKKGMQVFCEGRPELKHYFHKNGAPGFSLQLRVLYVHNLDTDINRETLISPNAIRSDSSQPSERVADTVTDAEFVESREQD